MSDSYFFIKSKVADYYITTTGDEKGDKLSICTKKEDDFDQQLWKFDKERHCLTSKKTNLIMDIEGGDLKVDSKIIQYEPKLTMNHNQRWGMLNDYIYSTADPTLVMSVKAETIEEGANLIVCRKSEQVADSQQWIIESLK